MVSSASGCSARNAEISLFMPIFRGINPHNDLRARANADASRDVTQGYSLDELCDEWAREFYFEGIFQPLLSALNSAFVVRRLSLPSH